MIAEAMRDRARSDEIRMATLPAPTAASRGATAWRPRRIILQGTLVAKLAEHGHQPIRREFGVLRAEPGADLTEVPRSRTISGARVSSRAWQTPARPTYRASRGAALQPLGQPAEIIRPTPGHVPD